jgi:signal transduction histidine kinase
MIEILLAIYLKLYTFIAKKRIELEDTDEWKIHAHLIIVLTTGILMWGYAIVAQFTITHPLPMIVGYICSSIHTLSPLLFRYTKNIFFNTNVILIAGLAHQSTYAFFTGGFSSPLIIWFAILPMIAGIICRVKGAIIWCFITTLVSSFFLILHLNGYIFPTLINQQGFIITQALLSFGWILLSTIIIGAYTILSESNNQKLKAKNDNIQNLVQILCHDISNPLFIVKMKLDLLNKRADLVPEVKNSLQQSLGGVKSISEIVNYVRQIYAVELGKMEVAIDKVCVYSLFEHLKVTFEEKLSEKKIELQYIGPLKNELFVYSNTNGLRHQVMSNLMSNAIKFSPNNSKIILKIEKLDSENVLISLIDQGEGIPADIIPKLFNYNGKTNRLGTNGEPGTGFGMPIVKTFIEKCKGKITIKTVYKTEGQNHGTTFTVELKRAS